MALPAAPLALRRARGLARPRDRLRRRLPPGKVRRRSRARLRPDEALRAGVHRPAAIDAAAATGRLWRRRAEYLPAPGAMAPLPYVVRERVQETADTWTLTLEPVAGEQPAVAPGQFVMVYVFGIGEVPISVSGAVGRVAPLVLTVRSVGAVTQRALRVRGRRGRSACAGRSAPAGRSPRPRARTWSSSPAGSGSRRCGGVLLDVLERRADYGELVLLYGARTPGDLLFRDELEQLGRRRLRRRDRRRRRRRRGTARSGSCRSWCRVRASTPRRRQRSCAAPRS